MRHAPLALGLGGFLLALGCNQFQPIKPGPAPQQAAAVPTATPGAAQLVAYLNDNARRIQSLDCGDLDMDAKQKSQSVGLRGWMVCQKPRNFRMAAKVLGKQEMDMGSNDNEFWFWVARGDPYLFYCSYDDLNNGKARLPFPFQPEWMMQAMGMAEYGPPENYKVNATPHTLELVEEVRSPQGGTVRKITVFRRGPAQAHQPQVMAYLLQDANGKEICSAHVGEVQQDRATGAIVPRQVRIVWPAENVEMKLKLDGLSVNGAIADARARTLFSRPQLSVPGYDLARGPDAPPGGVRRTGGFQMR